MILLPLTGFSFPYLRGYFRAIACLGLASCFSSCAVQPLTVQTQYFSHEDQASYQIGTPDPSLDNPSIGERLLVQWALPPCEFEERGLTLYLKVRFANHQEREVQVPIEKKRGYYLYDLRDQEYCETGGIMTYLVEIRRGECVVAAWKHPLWTPLITFHSKNSSD